MTALWRALTVVLCLTAVSPAAAQDATGVIERFHATLVEVMKAGPRLGFAGRAEMLAPLVQATYDLRGMTRAAIGAEAARLPPEKFDRLAEAFTRYTVANYARQFSSYDGERFEIGKPAPARRGGGVLVPTRIVPPGGEPARLTYLMRQGEEGWRVVDVLLDGSISQLAVRRSEFQSVIRHEGTDGLLQVLERRIAALAAG